MARGVELVGDIKKLEKALMKLAQPRFDRAGREVGEALTSSTIQRFATSRAPDGTPWARLARSTVTPKVKDYRKDGSLRKGVRERMEMRKTLIQSSRLKNSISFKVRGSQVHVGTNIKYAAVHQFGHQFSAFNIVPRKSGGVLFFDGVFAKKVRHPAFKVPARPYLGISSADKHEIERIVLEHLGNL